MISDDLIADHYNRADLAAAIESGFAALGKTPADVTIDDLAVVDEFHTGGRAATELVLGRLGIGDDATVLDVGCGLGGAARYCADRFGCRVVGIDLTPSYIDAAKVLTGWLGLEDRVTHAVVSAQDLAAKKVLKRLLPDGAGAGGFDAAYLLHVGMNVADKTGLFSALHRVVRPGGRVAVYDLMRAAPGELTYPMPWASTAATSLVATPASYESALTAAGFELVSSHEHTDTATAFVRQIRERSTAEGGPPPVGLHLVMGPTVGEKVANLIAALDAGLLVPVELHARRS